MPDRQRDPIRARKNGENTPQFAFGQRPLIQPNQPPEFVLSFESLATDRGIDRVSVTRQEVRR
jgi:hypothetical protein